MNRSRCRRDGSGYVIGMSPGTIDPDHPDEFPDPEELPRSHEATTVEEGMAEAVELAPPGVVEESAYTPADDVRADGDRWLDERRDADADHHRRGHDLTGRSSMPPEEEGL